jgi:hypothetical protein
LAFNFNNNPINQGAPGDSVRAPLSASSPTAPDAPAVAPGPAASTASAVTSDNPQSAAFVRFGSCRWQQPAEDGNAAFCTHREVKPYAGTAGFDADAWCPECQYYKLRRAPKKRDPRDEYTY